MHISYAMKYSWYLFLMLILSQSLFADKFDYIYPDNSPSFSNFGTQGLLNIPNARFLPEGSLAFTWNKNEPYLRGSIVAYPFDWLEASYGYTDINSMLYSSVKAFSGGQSYKDKGFSTKIKLLNEKRFIPALAVGVRDAAGTGYFSSEYFVASKRIGNIDATVGLGWGFLNAQGYKNPFTKIDPSFDTRGRVEGSLGGEFEVKSFFSGPMGAFAGLELFIPNSNGARIKMEYDATDYTREANQFLEQDSKFNIGVTYPVSNRLSVKFGIVRGNTLNFGFSLKSNFSTTKKGIPKSESPKLIKNSTVYRRVNSKDRNLYLTSLKFLGDESIYLQSANWDKQANTFEVAYAQNKYVSYVRAAGRAFNTLNQISPDSIDTFKLTNINADLGLNTLVLDRNKLSRNQNKPFVPGYTISNSDIEPADYSKSAYSFNPKAELPKHKYRIAPTLKSQIGGPDGFFFGDLRIMLKSELIIKKNLTISSKFSSGIFNNFDDLKLASTSILPHVRTDIVDYLKESEKFSIDTLQLNYYTELSKSIYSKVTFGYLEEMFFGVGGETLYRPFFKNWGIGAEIWRVSQRDYNQRLGLRDYKTTTGFINMYYYHAPSSVMLALKGGKFLAQDSGIRLNLSRIFKSGLRMGIFATKTDISREEFGEGSFDKGFYFFIPIESFFTTYSKGYTGFGLRPVTRDGGAVLNTQYNLWNVTDQGSAYNFERNWEDIYE